MKSARSFKEFEALNGISMEEVLTVFEAVSEAFPMIVAANLTKNTYTMIKDDGFLANDMPSSGKYDDLIDVGVENIHPNYQRAFLDNFSRERLLQMLGQDTAQAVGGHPSHDRRMGGLHTFKQLGGRPSPFGWLSLSC